MWLHGAEQDGQVVAVARSFQRTVRVAGAERVVLGLAGVCTDAAQRGRGYGRLVVEAAFARLTAACPVCLFQTQVPGFYTGLGAREIVAEVVNSASDERAFWDPHVMIYPATASWPAGTIDLLGPGW
jgi:predicted GNAT family N-acyltransferase